MSVDPGDDTQPRVGTRLACTAARAIRVASGGAWAQVEEETGVPRASLGDPEMLGCLPKPSALGSDGGECGGWSPVPRSCACGRRRHAANAEPSPLYGVPRAHAAFGRGGRSHATTRSADPWTSSSRSLSSRCAGRSCWPSRDSQERRTEARGKGEVESGGEGLEGWEMVGDHVGAVELLQAIWNREEQ